MEDVQSRKVIQKKYPKQPLSQILADLARAYLQGGLLEKSSPAWRRFDKMIDFATRMGFHGVQKHGVFFKCNE